MSELPADIFSGLSNLEKLDLDFNELSELPADIFSGLSNLEELELSQNDLEELPISIFDDLDNLKKLHLLSNPGTPFWYAGKKAGGLENHSGIRYTDLHGDTPETATPLPEGSISTLGRIYPVGDVDYFRLEVTESQQRVHQYLGNGGSWRIGSALCHLHSVRQRGELRGAPMRMGRR